MTSRKWKRCSSQLSSSTWETPAISTTSSRILSKLASIALQRSFLGLTMTSLPTFGLSPALSSSYSQETTSLSLRKAKSIRRMRTIWLWYQNSLVNAQIRSSSSRVLSLSSASTSEVTSKILKVSKFGRSITSLLRSTDLLTWRLGICQTFSSRFSSGSRKTAPLLKKCSSIPGSKWLPIMIPRCRGRRLVSSSLSMVSMSVQAGKEAAKTASKMREKKGAMKKRRRESTCRPLRKKP